MSNSAYPNNNNQLHFMKTKNNWKDQLSVDDAYYIWQKKFTVYFKWTCLLWLCCSVDELENSDEWV